MSNSPFEFEKLKPLIIEAGEIALGYFQTQLAREQKDDYSPVSEADRAVEEFLINKLRQVYPAQEYPIIAEESGGDWQDKEFVWVIDPIDGTRIFLDGLPFWCISLGLLRSGQVYRGIVYLPVLNELYYTDDEGQAFWNGQPLTGALQTDWTRDSFIAASSEAHLIYNMEFRRIRALGAVVTHQVYAARGVAVAALYRTARIWDLAAAHAILTAAGGTAVHLDGSPLSLADVIAQGKNKKPVLAGHPAVVEKLRPMIKLR